MGRKKVYVGVESIVGDAGLAEGLIAVVGSEMVGKGERDGCGVGDEAKCVEELRAMVRATEATGGSQ